MYLIVVTMGLGSPNPPIRRLSHNMPKSVLAIKRLLQQYRSPNLHPSHYQNASALYKSIPHCRVQLIPFLSPSNCKRFTGSNPPHIPQHPIQGFESYRDVLRGYHHSKAECMKEMDLLLDHGSHKHPASSRLTGWDGYQERWSNHGCTCDREGL